MSDEEDSYVEGEDDDYSSSSSESSESSKSEDEDADRQALLKKCGENAHKLSFLFTCSQEEFEAHADKNKKFWEILEVPKPDIHDDVITGTSTLRKLFQDHSFLLDSGPSFARTLGMLGKV